MNSTTDYLRKKLAIFLHLDHRGPATDWVLMRPGPIQNRVHVLAFARPTAVVVQCIVYKHITVSVQPSL